MPTHSDPASLIESLSARLAALEALLLAPAAEVPTATIRRVLDRAEVLAPELGVRLGAWTVNGTSRERRALVGTAFAQLGVPLDGPGHMLWVEEAGAPGRPRSVWRTPIATADPDLARQYADTILTIAGFRLED